MGCHADRMTPNWPEFATASRWCQRESRRWGSHTFALASHAASGFIQASRQARTHLKLPDHLNTIDLLLWVDHVGWLVFQLFWLVWFLWERNEKREERSFVWMLWCRSSIIFFVALFSACSFPYDWRLTRLSSGTVFVYVLRRCTNFVLCLSNGER